MAVEGLAWMDLETTGLDPLRDEILEIAVVISDLSINEISRFERIIALTPRGAARIAAEPYVQKMHEESGLLFDSQTHRAVSLSTAYNDLLEFLRSSGFAPGTLLLSGSGIMTFDMRFMREYMPVFESWVAYFPNDVGVLRRRLNMLGIDAPTVPESWRDGFKKHRAMDDTLAHMQEGRVLDAFLLEHLPHRG